MSRSRAIPTAVGLIAAVLVGGFVTTSSLIATLPAFQYDSQLPALLPFFLWAAAAGVGHLANLGRELAKPWRAGLGLWTLVPYGGLMLVSAVVPERFLPWWVGLAVAGVAIVPFLGVAVTAHPSLNLGPSPAPDERSRRGTFLVAIGLLLMAYAVTQNAVTMATIGVLLAVALGVASLMPHGLAHASRAWALSHWVALAWGSFVVWTSALLRGTTSFFDDVWYVLTVMVLAPLPLLIVNGRDSQGRPGPE
ncbi:MAG: hypothetical protein ACK5LN_02920 [Propioniciclava sp.]